MKFNWIGVDDADDKLQKFCIDLEYTLRPRITKFLMARLENECSGDFSSFHFDVDVINRQINISERTPLEYSRLIASDFDREINSDLGI